MSSSALPGRDKVDRLADHADKKTVTRTDHGLALGIWPNPSPRSIRKNVEEQGFRQAMTESFSENFAAGT